MTTYLLTMTYHGESYNYTMFIENVNPYEYFFGVEIEEAKKIVYNFLRRVAVIHYGQYIEADPCILENVVPFIWDDYLYFSSVYLLHRKSEHFLLKIDREGRGFFRKIHHFLYPYETSFSGNFSSLVTISSLDGLLLIQKEVRDGFICYYYSKDLVFVEEIEKNGYKPIFPDPTRQDTFLSYTDSRLVRFSSKGEKMFSSEIYARLVPWIFFDKKGNIYVHRYLSKFIYTVLVFSPDLKYLDTFFCKLYGFFSPPTPEMNLETSGRVEYRKITIFSLNFNPRVPAIRKEGLLKFYFYKIFRPKYFYSLPDVEK